MIRDKQLRCLVLGNDGRVALAIVRSLGRVGVKVVLGYDESNSLCRHSRYIEKKILFPSISLSSEKWLRELICHLEREEYDLVIPSSDLTLVPLVLNRDKIKHLAKFAIPDENGFNYTYNKHLTFKLAQELNIPCPNNYFVERVGEISSALKRLSFPIVVKPISSKIFKNGIVKNLNVEVAWDKKELLFLVKKFLQFNPVSLQDFIKGESIGNFFLMQKGELKAAFQHRRIHQPDFGNGIGGGSSYRQGEKINQRVFEYSLKILKKIKWNGVAMVEYLHDIENNKFYLIEINGRFWGSLPLAIVSGVDFPLWLFEAEVGKVLEKKTIYREGVFCRNMKRDFIWGIERFKRSKRKISLLFSLPRKIIKALSRIIKKQEYFDELVKDDLLPGLVVIFSIIKKILFLIPRKIYFWLQRKTLKLLYRFQLYRFYKLKLFKRILLKNKKGLKIAFVCQGNICRSPTAEHILKYLTNKKKISLITIESFGFNTKKNYQINRFAFKVAKNNKIEITGHKVREFNSEVFKENDIIFVFEISQYFYLTKNFPKLSNKVFLLGLFNQENDVEIEDPYNHNIEVYRKNFKDIYKSLNNLVSLLRNIRNFKS